jgi:protein-S-isoprenylcysteine O-methyltransferase Ste14
MSLTPVFEIGIWNAWIFMSVFLLQTLAMMLSDKPLREKSHIPADARRRGIERCIGVIGNLAWFLALAYSVFLPFRLGTPWFYLGLPLFIVGLLLMTVATANFLATPPDEPITKGAYRCSRHPLYLATFIIFLGSGVAAASWLFLLISIVMVLCFRLEALIEERYCLSVYDRAYRDYMRRTPRWIGLPGKPDDTEGF